MIMLFADDAKIYDRINQNQQPHVNRVQPSLNKGLEWAKDRRMLLNFAKCHHMQFGSHNIPSKYTMLDGRENFELVTVDSEKDLGDIIGNKPTFRDHINSKVKLANRNLGIIFRTFTFLDEETLLVLYKSFVRPDLEYSTPNWSPYYKKIKLLLRMYKGVSSIRQLNNAERLKKLGLPT